VLNDVLFFSDHCDQIFHIFIADRILIDPFIRLILYSRLISDRNIKQN